LYSFNAIVEKHFTKQERDKFLPKEKADYIFVDGKKVEVIDEYRPRLRRMPLFDEQELRIIYDPTKPFDENFMHKFAKKELYQEVGQFGHFRTYVFANIDFNNSFYGFTDGYFESFSNVNPYSLQEISYSFYFYNCTFKSLPKDFFEHVNIRNLEFIECDIEEFPIHQFLRYNNARAGFHLFYTKIHKFPTENKIDENEQIINNKWGILKFKINSSDNKFFLNFLKNVLYTEISRLEIDVDQPSISLHLDANETALLIDACNGTEAINTVLDFNRTIRWFGRLPNFLINDKKLKNYSRKNYISKQFKNILWVPYYGNDVEPIKCDYSMDFSKVNSKSPELENRKFYIYFNNGLITFPPGIENLRKISAIGILSNELDPNTFYSDWITKLESLNTVRISESSDFDIIANSIKEIRPKVEIKRGR
jgi:hypothetical protein